MRLKFVFFALAAFLWTNAALADDGFSHIRKRQYVACGIGTETSGSIIMPATLASCVGIKPSIGLISRTGIIPLGKELNTWKRTRDAAVLLCCAWPRQ